MGCWTAGEVWLCGILGQVEATLSPLLMFPQLQCKEDMSETYIFISEETVLCCKCLIPILAAETEIMIEH